MFLSLLFCLLYCFPSFSFLLRSCDVFLIHCVIVVTAAIPVIAVLSSTVLFCHCFVAVIAVLLSYTVLFLSLLLLLSLRCWHILCYLFSLLCCGIVIAVLLCSGHLCSFCCCVVVITALALSLLYYCHCCLVMFQTWHSLLSTWTSITSSMRWR